MPPRRGCWRCSCAELRVNGQRRHVACSTRCRPGTPGSPERAVLAPGAAAGGRRRGGGRRVLGVGRGRRVVVVPAAGSSWCAGLRGRRGGGGSGGGGTRHARRPPPRAARRNERALVSARIDPEYRQRTGRRLDAAPYDDRRCSPGRSARSRARPTATSSAAPSTCTAAARDRRAGRGLGRRAALAPPRRTRATSISDIAFWVVICGVIGARLYHVITDYQLFETTTGSTCSRSGRAGSAIWGAVIGGAIAVVVITRRRKHLPTLAVDGLHRRPALLRAGDRPVGQLVQPGAVREADDAAVGARDRAGSTARRDTSSTRRSSRRSSTSRSTASLVAASLLLWSSSACRLQARADRSRSYVDHLHVRPVLVREPAHRPRAPHRGLRVNAWVRSWCSSCRRRVVRVARAATSHERRRPVIADGGAVTADRTATTCPSVHRSAPPRRSPV